MGRTLGDEEIKWVTVGTHAPTHTLETHVWKTFPGEELWVLALVYSCNARLCLSGAATSMSTGSGWSHVGTSHRRDGLRSRTPITGRHRGNYDLHKILLG